MELRILKTESDYEEAVARVEALMDRPEDDEAAMRELELLGFLVATFERERLGAGNAKPIEMVKFLMDQRGLTQVDLAPAFGDKARVSDFLAGRRGLSLSTIAALSDLLKIPTDLLVDKDIVRKPRGGGIAKARNARGRKKNGILKRISVGERKPARSSAMMSWRVASNAGSAHRKRRTAKKK